MNSLAFPTLPPVTGGHPLLHAVSTLSDEIALFEQPDFCGVDEEYRIVKLERLQLDRVTLQKQIRHDQAQELAAEIQSRKARQAITDMVCEVTTMEMVDQLSQDAIDDPAASEAFDEHTNSVLSLPLEGQIAHLLDAGNSAGEIRRRISTP